MRVTHRLFAFLLIGIVAMSIVFAAGDAMFHPAPATRALSGVWLERFGLAILEVAFVLAMALAAFRWGIMNPAKHTTNWLRDRRLGTRETPATPVRAAGVFTPLVRELSHLVTSLDSARASAQQEARLRDAGESVWTAERLRVHTRSRLGPSPLVVISNREPYMHVQRGSAVQTIVPASGLVTALEPILRACHGTWIAHGSGSADRLTVDAHDRLRVPPEEPQYMLRRVWLTPEEEEGYYYGFSNEGLWPLCHIAHTRPTFRESDWRCYEQANRHFARAALKELEGAEQPLVLVQDYHFSLLPRLIKQERPDARVGVFWHIPWPNPEAFGICPWQVQLLDGLLGADLIGFHTQAHCNNFLDTVDRACESQIEREHFRVRRHDHTTIVRPFPISVDVPLGPAPEPLEDLRTRESAWLKALGIRSEFVGIGVDRIDYTKGLLERLHGLERFFEKWDHFRGHFTFVQIGAPSRTRLPQYGHLVEQVVAETERINRKFATADWQPIVLLTRHHSHEEIRPFYRMADVCMVTSLHDGMNLVAKEFVAERNDEDGVLVLSQFTGASRELTDALIVNPYDIEQLADAIRKALEMPVAERQERMRRMRATVRDHNIYRWAANLISGLADVRVSTAEVRA